METIEERRVFIVATADPERAKKFSDLIQKHIAHSTVFTAEEGPETIFKVENFPPHVLIIDSDLPKQNGIEVIEALFKKKDRYEHMAIIVVSTIPDKEHFVDEVVTCKIQFLEDPNSELKLNICLTRALNFVAKDTNQEYQLHFLTPKEVLFKKGDRAVSVYIVKKGELIAYVGESDNEKILGKVQAGEFVGEMAHINGEPRSATVRALTDCELIEIPSGKLDMVLFSKPAWSKALVQTLSRRLKRTNETLAKS